MFFLHQKGSVSGALESLKGLSGKFTKVSQESPLNYKDFKGSLGSKSGKKIASPLFTRVLARVPLGPWEGARGAHNSYFSNDHYSTNFRMICSAHLF